MPKGQHAGRTIDLPDDWWAEAGMARFVPEGQGYRAGPPEPDLKLEGKPVFMLAIGDVAPFDRALSYGLFRNRDDVLKILRGFLNGDRIPPIQVVRLREGVGYTHRIFNGVHRFYSSVLAGFTHVPAIEIVPVFVETSTPLDAE